MLVNMKHLLSAANEQKFAIPAFNTSTNMMLRGLIEAAEETASPMIIEIHPDELEFARASFVQAVIDEAHRTSVPVCIHMDHGSKKSQIVKAIRCGYTSVMIDASDRPFDENVKICREICELAHVANVSVEGELGTIGTTNQGMGATTTSIIQYTDPEDARRFVEESGVDTLAVAIGTCHGIYPDGMKPKLQLERLKEIKEKVGIPLVLHGGSANRDDEIAAASQMGINKINISSDVKDAFYQKCREVLQDPYLREPEDIYTPCIEAMKKVAIHKFHLLKAAGKAGLY